MKRSKIIKIIQQHIKSITPEDIVEDSWASADELLTKLEEAGMLPPPLKGQVKVVVDGDGLVIPIWGWEEESKPLSIGILERATKAARKKGLAK
jgi:hypothetical protein